MFRSTGAKWIIALIVAIAVLTLLRFKPWRHGDAGAARQELSVGFLPVT